MWVDVDGVLKLVSVILRFAFVLLIEVVGMLILILIFFDIDIDFN